MGRLDGGSALLPNTNMRLLLLSLGMCMLPAALTAQRLVTTSPAPRPAVVPIQRAPLRVCGVGFTVSVRCGFNPRRPYRGLERTFSYDRAYRPLGALPGRYDRPSGRTPYYADPGFPACPPSVGGVTVVSPPNARYSAQQGSTPVYSGYALVPLASKQGCAR
jgi:hypothetical protein